MLKIPYLKMSPIDSHYRSTQHDGIYQSARLHFHYLHCSMQCDDWMVIWPNVFWDYWYNRFNYSVGISYMTLEERPELLSCPCCGSDAKLHQDMYGNSIQCTDTRGCGLSQILYAEIDEAARRWNKRIRPTSNLDRPCRRCGKPSIGYNLHFYCSFDCMQERRLHAMTDPHQHLVAADLFTSTAHALPDEYIYELYHCIYYAKMLLGRATIIGIHPDTPDADYSQWIYRQIKLAEARLTKLESADEPIS